MSTGGLRPARADPTYASVSWWRRPPPNFLDGCPICQAVKAGRPTPYEQQDFVWRLAEGEEAHEPLPDTPLDPEPEPEGGPSAMTFYVTFTGLGLRVREHPTFPAAHPDGWLTIHAEDENAAAAAVVAALGPHWGQLMPDQPDAATYPRGELGVLDARCCLGITP